MNIMDRLSQLNQAANNAVIDNIPEQEGQLYVKRGENECLVAKPMCHQWAAYLAALIKVSPAMAAVVNATQAIIDAKDLDFYDPIAKRKEREATLRAALIELNNQQEI